MDISFYICGSDRRYLEKTLDSGETISGSLRNESTVVAPHIVIASNNPTVYNYAYIPAFGRYYYVNDWQSIRSGIWECALTVDVLMSYATSIRNAKIALSNTQDTQSNDYLSSEIYKSTVKQKTDILSFPNGLLEQGEYILITAGG